jgi:hypothetical protein
LELIFHDQTAAFRICTKPHKAALLQTSRKAAGAWGVASKVLAMSMWLFSLLRGRRGASRAAFLVLALYLWWRAGARVLALLDPDTSMLDTV